MAKSYSAGTLEVGLLTTANEVSKVFSALNAELRTTQKLVASITGKSSKISNATANAKSASKDGAFGFLKMAKWSSILIVARRLGRAVSTIAQAGANYTETLNLWETSMGTNVTLATEFVKKMNEAYGISEKTLMNAQATFKNMLGGLGNISQETAYALSEGITQMAVDYASLYNVTFEQAFTKFQAALAGQVRPIRSVSGFDITEQTLFSLYQQLGGEKTMRQLNRTEKQLLAILAIFQQMEATGTTGDLRDTMDSFANQSRVMAENMQRVSSYAGILVTHWIQQSGLLVNINALLIFLGDTLLAVAEATGAIEHYADPFGDITNGALDASEATDELNGKLLDFDKFRALNQSEDTNALGLDKKLLQALSGYETILKNAKMEAKELAESWKVMSGLFDEDGAFNIERWEDLVDKIEMFGHALLAVIASKAITGIVSGITSITLASKGLSNVLLTGVIFAILQAIDAFRDGEYMAGVIAITIGVTLVGAILMLKTTLIDGTFYFDLFGKTVNATFVQISMGVAMLAGGIISLIQNWDKMSDKARELVPVLSLLAGTITALAVGATILKGNWLGALTIGAMVTGAGLMVGSAFASDSNVVSAASTMNKAPNTNAISAGMTSGMRTEQAMYSALTRYGQSQGGNDQSIKVYLDGEQIYENTTSHAKRRGKVWSNA